ncbi:MAG: BNR-4 repeat-containing protein [Bacteroidaceae bacterium]|nr:BNR-4 repeat-containing protein [Bacteroidaceae bacterium]
MKHLIFSFFVLCLPFSAYAQSYSGNLVADEGAWCWFADPRALHYENEDNSINSTYIGYIDVHGNVKATQYDWVKNRKTDVLIRSYFQPDDHNNPTFVVLPDERVMIFYTRHTDEAKIWYRISRTPGDISSLGDEKYLATANNTTYPSPFILSDDPEHIYLCWRGIKWHPTIARLTIPDANDNCQFDFGPKQIVQSTGSRPYAKYQSNGKDKIYLSYTTGHPDNEMPDWLYFNVIDINKGNGPILRDIKGTQLKKISDGVFNVSKTSSYASSYPFTIVDNTDNIRNWVWQITLDKDENPVIAYPHIDNEKTSHVYWYARWNGSAWKRTWVQYAGHAFHQNWNSTERCYSGGMAVDPENINDLYLSIPTKNGAYDKDGVYEIWKYTIDDSGNVAGSEQITRDSEKNNVRPFIIPGSKNSPMRLAWMNGDYYYWMVQKNYPKGYPTDIRCDYAWQETTREMPANDIDCVCFGPGQTLQMAFAMNEQKYEGVLFQSAEGFTYSLGSDGYPVITINGIQYKSQNRLLTSDDWAKYSTGTSGDNHPTKLSTWILTLTYDGNTMTAYRNGLVDQVIDVEGLEAKSIEISGDGFNHACLSSSTKNICATPLEVQALVSASQKEIEENKVQNALQLLEVPAETRTDLVLPTEKMGLTVTWSSSNPDVISANGILAVLISDTPVTLAATISGKTRTFEVKALARAISQNLRYDLPEALDLTANTASGFATNKYGLAPEGLLCGLRSYSVLLTVNIKTMTKQPRLYDFGGGSGNSLFLRADALSAGIKYANGSTTMVNSSTKLQTGKDYKLAVTYDAATRVTHIYIDGQEDASGSAITSEPYMLYETAGDARNYIGRTQWWDGAYAADNQDFCGTIGGLQLYDICLTQKEICELQSLPFEEEEHATSFVNGDFESSYAPMENSGVSSDRAIYIPEGWTLDYSTRDVNDLTAFASGDLYYSQFFASKPQNSDGDSHTLWIRQRWYPSILNYYQEVMLEAGKYKLSADIFASDNSSNNTASVYVGRTTRTVTSVNQWQQVSIDFETDGSSAIAIGAKADHKSNEFICGFDNFILVKNTPDNIQSAQSQGSNTENIYYDITGRRVSKPTHGIYMSKGGKVLRF